jgi:hypothetical protein
MNIGQGDWVECIDDSPGKYQCKAEIAKGQIYCIDALDTTSFDIPCVQLVGKTDPYLELWWGVHRFRPIYRPSNLIENLLKEPCLVDS